MKKNRKFLICGFLIVCAGILLIIGNQVKKQNELLNKPFYINDEEFQFESEENTEVSIEIDGDEIVVLLPEDEKSLEKRWVIEKSNIYASFEDSTITKENQYFRQIKIDLKTYDTYQIPFKLIKNKNMETLDNSKIPCFHKLIVKVKKK